MVIIEENKDATYLKILDVKFELVQNHTLLHYDS